MSPNRDNDHFCFNYGYTEGFCYNRIRVAYEEAGTSRLLRFFIPVPLMSVREYRNLQMSGTGIQIEKDKWRELIECSLEKAKKQGLLEKWIAPVRSAVVYTLYAKNRLRRVQNYALFAVNAALKDNKIIKDDGYICYFVHGKPVDSQDLEGTGIAVIDLGDSDVTIFNTSITEILKM